MDEPMKVYRDTENKMIAGVCAGMAEYLGLDVVLIRTLAVLLGVFTGGSALSAYIIIIFIATEKPLGSSPLGKK